MDSSPAELKLVFIKKFNHFLPLLLKHPTNNPGY